MIRKSREKKKKQQQETEVFLVLRVKKTVNLISSEPLILYDICSRFTMVPFQTLWFLPSFSFLSVLNSVSFISFSMLCKSICNVYLRFSNHNRDSKSIFSIFGYKTGIFWELREVSMVQF